MYKFVMILLIISASLTAAMFVYILAWSFAEIIKRRIRFTKQGLHKKKRNVNQGTGGVN